MEANVSPFLSGMAALRLGPSAWGAHTAFGLGLPLEKPQILAAVQWHVCPRKQARVSVDLGLGPEPPVLFLRDPWPPIADYYHQQGYLEGGAGGEPVAA